VTACRGIYGNERLRRRIVELVNNQIWLQKTEIILLLPNAIQGYHPIVMVQHLVRANVLGLVQPEGDLPVTL
jgi:hypothetical protein